MKIENNISNLFVANMATSGKKREKFKKGWDFSIDTPTISEKPEVVSIYYFQLQRKQNHLIIQFFILSVAMDA